MVVWLVGGRAAGKEDFMSVVTRNDAICFEEKNAAIMEIRVRDNWKFRDCSWSVFPLLFKAKLHCRWLLLQAALRNVLMSQ